MTLPEHLDELAERVTDAINSGGWRLFFVVWALLAIAATTVFFFKVNDPSLSDFMVLIFICTLFIPLFIWLSIPALLFIYLPIRGLTFILELIRPTWSTLLGCSSWIIVLLLIVGYYVNKEIKERRMVAREQFIKDSLAHDKHYQDSLAEARRQKDEWLEQYELWVKQHTLVIVRDSDRFYHTSTECDDVSINWHDQEKADSVKMSDFRIILLQEAIDSGLKKCYECEEIYDKYLESFD